MSNPPDWLPEALRYADFGGDYEKFFATVYRIFERDFKQSRPNYGGRPVTYDSGIQDGKELAFWHITSRKDNATGERVPNFRRCERVAWPKAIVDHSDDNVLKVWRNTRGGKTRILLWLEELDYLVVLEERPGVVTLVTAYCTDEDNRRRQLKKEWRKCSSQQTPPRGAT